ncbi:MAG: hypothetical protein ACJ79E_05450 [Anaeromyxobacteraceae bacterium]
MGRSRFWAAASLGLAIAASAQAAVGFKAESGWEASIDGFVNVFAVDQFEPSGAVPPATAVDALGQNSQHNTFRFQTGLLPGLVAINAASPDLGGLKIKTRIGFYPQVQTSGGRVLSNLGQTGGTSPGGFGSQIDLREIFFTVDGSFGQVLAGRALNLFQGQNILTDMTLFGVGVQGAAIGNGGTTAGRIGYGYIYTSFGPQFRYTTPDLGGMKLAVAIGDPTNIDGIVSGGPTATDVRLPEVEAELSFTGKSGDMGYHAWVSGLAQRAWLASGTDVTAAGGSAGAGVTLGPIDLLASGFYGQALGSIFMLQLDALDATGKERTSYGFLGQAGLKVGATKLGLSYGQNTKKETDADAAVRSSAAEVDTRRSITGGLYHDVNPALKLIAEYTWAQTKWYGGADRSSNVVALGAFVFF